MMVAMQQMKYQKEQDEWSKGMEMKKFGLDERQAQAYERYQGARIGEIEQGMKAPPKPPEEVIKIERLGKELGISYPQAFDIFKGNKSLSQLKAEERAKAEGRAAGTPVKPETPTIHDSKIAYWTGKWKKGDVKDDEYHEIISSLMGGPSLTKTEDYSGPKGAAQRNANYNALEKAWYTKTGNYYTPKKIRDIVEQSGGNPPVDQEGLRVDMPHKYNWALLNKNDGVGSEDDVDTLMRYDAMFQVFQMARGEGVAGHKEFLEWAKDKPFKNDKKFDWAQVRKWFEYYR